MHTDVIFEQSSRLPLTKCLEKFTEDEMLEDVVCPECMKRQNARSIQSETGEEGQHMEVQDSREVVTPLTSDALSPVSDVTPSTSPEPGKEEVQNRATMCKSISLWRLPPVLIIQLKRFQYDYYRRRKLTIHVVAALWRNAFIYLG